MSIIGIVAEFNPFHNGHQYLMQSIRENCHSDGIICVMSGSFVQRGEPAICNKWARTRMALAQGADLVIELPFCFAVRSAYSFARGSVRLLERTGVVTHLAFGSESGQIDELQTIADLIANESPMFKQRLKQALDQGHSFPAARTQALKAVLPIPSLDLDHLLSQSNNILALEYLRVISEEHMQIIPMTVPRLGSSYNSQEISSYASASALRNAILQGQSLEDLRHALPTSSLQNLKQEIEAGRAPIRSDQLEQIILYKLRTIPVQELSEIHELTEGLEHRIQEAAVHAGSLEELRQSIKSKRYSMTRIDRALLYTIFHFTAQQAKSFDEAGPLYHHILGFSAKGQKILQEMRNKSTIPTFSRGSDVKAYWQTAENPLLHTMLDLDLTASNIYSLLYPQKQYRQGYADFTTSPIRI